MWPYDNDPNQVDFQASPDENAGRIVTDMQINELSLMSEADRQQILTEHLNPEQRLEAEQSIDTIIRFEKRLEKLRAKHAPVPPPTYNKEKRLLFFSDEVIQIPINTDQEALCRALFRGGKPVKKPLDIGDALAKLGVPPDTIKGNKKISYAKREINTRVAKQTGIDNLLVIQGKQIWFNEKYT